MALHYNLSLHFRKRQRYMKSHKAMDYLNITDDIDFSDNEFMPQLNDQFGSSDMVYEDYQSLLNALKEYQRNISYENTSNNDRFIKDLLTHYILGIGGLCVACFGAVGNVLSLVVLNQRSFNSATYSYLSALSVCDTLMLVSTIVLLWKDLRPPDMSSTRWVWDNGIYPYLFPYFHAAAFTFQVISIWLTLAFTVDRWVIHVCLLDSSIVYTIYLWC